MMSFWACSGCGVVQFEGPEPTECPVCPGGEGFLEVSAGGE